MWSLSVSEWISIGESVILLATIVVMLVGYKQTARHHREDIDRLMAGFRSQVHERVLSDLLGLNQIMLQYPKETTGLFRGGRKLNASQIRANCYVYAILDLLNFMVLHLDIIDPYMENHIQGLARLLYTEPRMKTVFEAVRPDQSKALIAYLDSKVKPSIGAAIPPVASAP